jgi:hypothetical protein
MFAPDAEWQRHCRACAEIPKVEKAAFFSLQGYILDLAPAGTAPEFGHAIAGEHTITGAVCGDRACAAPLLRMLTLDLRDPKLAFIGGFKRCAAGGVPADHLPLFYCWRCGGMPEYRLLENGAVEMLGTMSFGPPERPDHPTHFPPHPAVLAPISADVQRVISACNDQTLDSDTKFGERYGHLLRPRHQVGGEPYLSQGSLRDPDECLVCRGPAPILATAADDAGDGRKFVGDSFVHVTFTYCAKCQIVTAQNECD